MITRKDIVENSYVFGGLIGWIAISIIVFILSGSDAENWKGPIWLWWIFRPLISIFFGLIFVGIIGGISAGIVYLILLPFYKKIPWDRPNKPIKKVVTSIPEKIIPIEDRFEIMDL